MTLPPEFIARLRREIEDVRQRVASMKSGELLIRQRLHGGAWEDITENEVTRCEQTIATYQQIVGRNDHRDTPASEPLPIVKEQPKKPPGKR